MSRIKELLTDQLQDMLGAESQLVEALPKMVEASKHPKLKEAFQKHLEQTELHAQRLRKVFELLGEEVQAIPCKAMAGLIAEGEETIQKGAKKDSLAADLALIAAAQRVEHYEIACYGTARNLARQLGEFDCARLLSHTLGEEETADFLLTAIADPLLQQATIEDTGAAVNLENAVGTENVEKPTRARRKKSEKRARAAG